MDTIVCIKKLNNASKRPPTNEELEAFMFSKWSNTWALLTPFIFPMCILAIMDEGIGISIVFLPFLIFLAIPFYIAYKKREKYINSIMVYPLKGTIWFDEENFIHKINKDELKLHRKWRKILKKKTLPIHNVEIEALLHTYDNLDLKVCKKFQPISIKSNVLNINETTLKSTRNWGVIFLYWVAFGIIALYAPDVASKGNLILNPLELLNRTENYLFAVSMTLLWWIAIITTVYLSIQLFNRIKGHYF